MKSFQTLRFVSLVFGVPNTLVQGYNAWLSDPNLGIQTQKRCKGLGLRAKEA